MEKEELAGFHRIGSQDLSDEAALEQRFHHDEDVNNVSGPAVGGGGSGEKLGLHCLWRGGKDAKQGTQEHDWQGLRGPVGTGGFFSADGGPLVGSEERNHLPGRFGPTSLSAV